MSTHIILRLLITLLILDTSSARPLWAWIYYDDYPLQEYPALDEDATPYDDTYVIQKRTESNNVETEEQIEINSQSSDDTEQMIRDRKIFLPNQGSFDPWGGYVLG